MSAALNARSTVDGTNVAALMTSAPHRIVANLAGPAVLAADLAGCLGRIGTIASAEPLIVSDVVAGVVGGGKRLRPLLVLATAYAAAAPLDPRARDRAVQAGAVVELLHLASLVHDDVMDESATRHGVDSVNIREGNIRAVLAGDYLLAQGLLAGSSLGAEEGAVAARTFSRLCEGQARESAALFDVDRTEESYLEAISGKTAALLATACRLGAMAVGLPADAVEALAAYGHHMGLAFQLVDDLLDVTSSAEALGKPAGHDIVEGVYTLPVVHALRERPGLRELLRRGDRAAAAVAVRVVRETGGLDVTRRAAEAHSAQAIDALSAAAEHLSPAGRTMLAELADVLVERRH
ncbi:polyprenyl synthetase family protein [Amycolatopsis sp. NPDC051758]|uniref:polyprenyl synthetase family protein n=1 Tax=Amycolatopsis sp. NPDC051758 TaxID=3363935 RepID=UPI0037B18382